MNFRTTSLLLIIIVAVLLFQSCSRTPRPAAYSEYTEAMNSYVAGHNDKALQILKKLHRETPAFTQASLLYGRVLFYSEQYSDAVSCLEKTLEGNMNLDGAKILIRSYLMLDNASRAEEVLDHAAQYSSEDPELLYLKARCRLMLDDPEGAMSLLTAACTIMERQIEIPLELASLYSRYGLYSKAFKIVDRYDHFLKENHPLKQSISKLKNEYQEKKKTRQ